MTNEEIIDDWFNRDLNVSKINTVVYVEEIYNFIIATCAKRHEDIYLVNNDWQRVLKYQIHTNEYNKLKKG